MSASSTTTRKRHLSVVADLPTEPAPIAPLSAEFVLSLPPASPFAEVLIDDMLGSEPFAAIQGSCVKIAALKMANGASLAEIVESTARFVFAMGMSMGERTFAAVTA